ncbi:MAG: Pycsar system effector family protein [Bacteroidota bacterium]
MDYNLVLKTIPPYIASYVETHALKVQLVYHNMLHTEQVVEAAKQIGNHYQLNDHDFFVVVAAAWFHDLGYYSGESEGHEAKGAGIAAAFLIQQGVEEQTIAEVKGCILATQMPQNPQTLLEKIVSDADLFHFGTDEFPERNKLMRKEYEIAMHSEIDKNEWRARTIHLLQTHQYHTDYCQLLLNDKKQENLDRLLKKYKEPKPGKANEQPVEAVTAPVLNDKITDRKKEEKPTRGIETMFRVASANHQRLSDMADSKANIMISVNAIIISVVIGFVGRKLEATQEMLAPTMLLLIGCVTAIIFAVLATRPKIPGGYFTPEQVDNKTVNLLFFGNFYNMNYESYYEGMKKLMADSEFLYASLTRDIHSQGKVLGTKYKLLRISYTIFMFTLIISVLAFGITFTFFDK